MSNLVDILLDNGLIDAGNKDELTLAVSDAISAFLDDNDILIGIELDKALLAIRKDPEYASCFFVEHYDFSISQLRKKVSNPKLRNSDVCSVSLCDALQKFLSRLHKDKKVSVSYEGNIIPHKKGSPSTQEGMNPHVCLYYKDEDKLKRYLLEHCRKTGETVNYEFTFPGEIRSP